MKDLLKFIPKFKNQPVLVLGDIMIDKFIWGKVSRISPEAPVPVVEVTRESDALGGAGNVASNLASLGGMVKLISVVGKDFVGSQLMEFLSHKSIETESLVMDEKRPTSIKTRIIAQHQQVVRVDREEKGNFSSDIEKNILRKLEDLVPAVSAVIISDYGKGVISPKVLSAAIKLAKRNKVPITVDPKIEHFMKYKGVSCITPNTNEAAGGMRYIGPLDDDNIVALGKRILQKLSSKSVLITRGEKGMTLFEPGSKITHIPTRAKEVYDVTGAGDTVIATFTLALAAGAKFREAAEIANFAAGIVVAKLGTATTTTEEIESAIKSYTK